MWILESAFTLFDLPVTWLEIIAFVLALITVSCNVFEIHWSFVFSIIASGMYAWFFVHSGIYGEASVNVFFALISFWGWWQWLFGKRANAPGPIRPVLLKRRGRMIAVAAWAVLWLICGLTLKHVASSTVPWWDGFVTAGSIVGAVLAGRKFIENWQVWVLVNTVSIGLFWYKGLVLTTGLYVVFLGLAFVGWAEWSRRKNQLAKQHAQQQLQQGGQAAQSL